MSEKSNYPVEFGSIFENRNKETGKTYLQISIFKDVVLKKGMKVKLEKPEAKYERIFNSPKSSEEFKATMREAQAKESPALKMRLLVKLED
jgi:Ulp1 family protease